ncbi:MAG: Smr/MutS family protein [Mariprofundaceae bacterium]|nr:Smr/MutS family protein [Mariprofundaceae bacterium]
MNNKKDDLFTDLFAEAMQQVQPIKKTVKIISSATPNKNKIRKDIHKKVSVSIPYKPRQAKSTLTENGSTWILRANGIAPDVLKKLSSGQFSINHSIDLHGMTRDQAISTLEHTLQSSLQTSERVLCIIHGRGLHSPDGKPVLKKSVYQWLKTGSMSDYILAVTPAPNTAGGSCLVLLRRDKYK